MKPQISESGYPKYHYEKPLNKVSDVVITSVDGVIQEGQVSRVKTLLAGLGRLRVDYGALGKSGFVYSTPTAGRKIWLEKKQVFDEIVALPDAVGPANVILSMKGVGAPRENLRLSQLHGHRNRLPGLVDLGDEAANEQLLTTTSKPIFDVYGKVVPWKIIPGRYFVGAIPIKTLHVQDRQIDLATLNQIEFPSITGDMTPHILFHANWSKWNYKDIEIISYMFRSNTFDKYKKIELSSQFLDISREIQENLRHHPHYADLVPIKEEGAIYSKNCAKWWGKYVARQMAVDFADSQVFKKIGMIPSYRHSQNKAFGGQVDFESIKTGSLVDSFLSTAWLQNINLLSNIASFMSIRDKLSMAHAMIVELNKWDYSRVNDVSKLKKEALVAIFLGDGALTT